MRVLLIAALALAPWSAGGADMDDLRSRITEISGRPLSAAVGAFLAPRSADGSYRPVFYRPHSAIWLMDSSASEVLLAGVLATGEGREADDRIDILWSTGSTSPVMAADLLALLQSVRPDGSPVALADCHDRVRIGGTLREAVGGLEPGMHLAAGRISSGGRPAGWYSGNGGDIRIRIGNSAEPEVAGCRDVAAALDDAPGIAGDGTLAIELATLLLTLEDGNSAMALLIEYQLQLKQLAASDPAAARSARLRLQDCLDTATMAVVCDRLVASFRPEDG